MSYGIFIALPETKVKNKDLISDEDSCFLFDKNLYIRYQNDNENKIEYLFYK